MNESWGNAELRDALPQLARQKPHYGYRRLQALLRRREQEVSAISRRSTHSADPRLQTVHQV